MNQVEGDNKKVEGIITNTSGESYKIEFDLGFKPGDVVRLKSGGPDMVVEKAKEYKVHCAWYSDGKMRKIVMRNDAVEYAREEVPPPKYNPYELAFKELHMSLVDFIEKEDNKTHRYYTELPTEGEIFQGGVVAEKRRILEKMDSMLNRLADKE